MEERIEMAQILWTLKTHSHATIATAICVLQLIDWMGFSVIVIIESCELTKLQSTLPYHDIECHATYTCFITIKNRYRNRAVWTTFWWHFVAINSSPELFQCYVMEFKRDEVIKLVAIIRLNRNWFCLVRTTDFEWVKHPRKSCRQHLSADEFV